MHNTHRSSNINKIDSIASPLASTAVPEHPPLGHRDGLAGRGLQSMIFIWTKRESSTKIMSNVKNQISPHEIAKNRLLHLDTNGFSKDFYSELSHITRQFVEKSCYIGALEMTTEEISQNENIFKMNGDIFFEWVSLLQKADLIKFAKKSTPITEMEDDKRVAFKVIEKALN